MIAGQRFMAWLRLAVTALSAFACFGAHALVQPAPQYYFSVGGYTSATVSTQQAACASYATVRSASDTTYNLTNPVWKGASDPLKCAFDFYTKAGSLVAAGNVLTGMVATAAQCPANSTAVSGGCQCNTGYDESGGQCVPHVNACTAKAGKPTVLRVTIGYSRTPDDNDTKAVGPTFAPWGAGNGTVCSGGCSMQYSGVESAWISQSPNAQGLYRNSVDATYIPTGQECTASSSSPADQAVNPDAAQPTCPGYVGEVNGKLGCYGTASAPVTSAPKPQAIPQPPVRAGNPPAGERPATGEGSAANPTPSAGNGGPGGGPAAAGVGGRGGTGGGTPSGTGTVSSPGTGEEQAQCGAPGQPKCGIDETGTPSNGGDAMGTGKLDQAMDKANDAIATVTDKASMDTSWGVVPSWFSSATCTPWTLGTLPIINRTVTVNVCPMQDYAVAVMTFLWCVGTFFAILGMVGRVVGAGAN